MVIMQVDKGFVDPKRCSVAQDVTGCNKLCNDRSISIAADVGQERFMSLVIPRSSFISGVVLTSLCCLFQINQRDRGNDKCSNIAKQ
jgi:hypothetical protein